MEKSRTKTSRVACTTDQAQAKPLLLAIDDDSDVLATLRDALEGLDVEVHTAERGAAGWDEFCRRQPAIVLLDLRLPDLDGMDLLARMVAHDPAAEIVVLTGFSSTASAVEAMRKGACNYVEKPFSIEPLRQLVEELLAAARRRRYEPALGPEELAGFAAEGIVGESPAMLALFRTLRRMAPHYRTALIAGPTGSGKELVARALHRLSPHGRGPLVVANCAAIVESLFESEVFGYVKGAFTGANGDKLGLFEAAHGGTLLLDEIGEMPLAMQGKLLRVIQTQQVTRVGAVTPRAVNVRIVGATNRDLKQEVEARRFREDLYFRLAAFEIRVPSLVERRADLPLLSEHFVRKFAAQYDKPVRGLSRRARAAIERHAWPGNVRELEHTIASACLAAEGEWIEARDLPAALLGSRQGPGPRAAPNKTPAGFETLEELSRRHAREVVAGCDGNKSLAAEALGISRATLYRLLREPSRHAS